MFEGHIGANQTAQHGTVTETSWVKKYVRATIPEADPQGDIRMHEGVVTQDFGKEIEVVNPHPIGTGFGLPPSPKYVTKRCHKEGAEEIPVPWTKAKGVEEISKRLDAQM
jgi:hypothetical protein